MFTIPGLMTTANTPAEALQQARDNWHYYKLEPTSDYVGAGSQTERIDNGYNMRGSYTREYQFIPVRYQYKKGGRWNRTNLLFSFTDYHKKEIE